MVYRFGSATTPDRTFFPQLEARLAGFEPYGQFSVNRNGTDQTLMTSTADNIIQFTTKALDTDSVFDTATYKYTPQKAGWYFVSLLVATLGGSTTENPEVAIWKNGTSVAAGGYSDRDSGDAGTSVRVSVSALVQMNGTTDYLQAAVYLPAGVTAISGALRSTNMFGWRLFS